ncbi:metallophosphoesterase [Bradyrhizobium sp. UFLA 03-164]|uniref:Metallophosphoesterase n=2 Tax=Bradyrhizobium uaiense TaxID=2594946 RepID=A0A6P1BHH5_9BRAD|nr:metallophosphoesterase [Bradyrhizobium uaiense]
MRLWILSDLHVELTRGWDLPSGDARPNFDVLVVAGDLVPRMERGVRWLLERVPDKPVVYVPGNHEFYGTDIDRTVEKAMEAAEGTKVFVLQDRWIKLGGVIFAGATLWTDFALFGDEHRAMTVAADQMNDYRKIRVGRYVERFRPPHALLRHRKSRTFLEGELRKPRGTGRLVVITHHAPMPSWGNLVAPPYTGAELTDDDVLAAAYRSDLTSLMWPALIMDGQSYRRRPADLWIYGHTHETEDLTIGHTRIVSNAKGYGPWLPKYHAWDNQRFDPNLIVEV